MSDKKQSPWGNSNGGNSNGGNSGGSKSGNDDAPDNVHEMPWGKTGGRSESSRQQRPSQNRGGGNRGGGLGGGEPPEIDEFIRRGQDAVRRFAPNGLNGNLLVLIIVAIVLLWAATGFYRVGPSERGVELIFGRYHETSLPGLHYNFPSPIGDVFLPSVDLQRRLNVGFRSSDIDRMNPTQSDIASESLMLTADENIVDLDFTVFWRIGDPRLYLFEVRDPEATLKVVAESAMREVVGQTTFDLAVTRGREEIEQNTLEVMQRILDAYDSGMVVEAVELQASDPPRDVIDAFNDVQRARQDRDRLRNEAEAYANSVVPQARGEAERTLREAEGYKERLTEEAKGEALQFLSVYESYVLAPEVTRQRMYLEVLGNVYRSANKVVIDPEISANGGQGVVPYLPLGELGNQRSTNNSSANSNN